IYAVNAGGAARLLQAANGSIRLIDISTMSAFDGCRSVYGRVKQVVEKQFLDTGGIVLRPGLGWSGHPGGMMGTLDRLVGCPVTPVIAGRSALRLIHADDISTLVVDLLESKDFSPRILTAAHPQPFTLPEILRRRGRQLGKRPVLVPLPWRLIWLGIRVLEA